MSSLKHPICKIHDLRLLQHHFRQLLEHAMHGVNIDIIIPILRRLELKNKGVRDSILQTRSDHARLFPQTKEKPAHTCKPSGELSVPPEADLIYGFKDVGWRQVSFRPNMRWQTRREGKRSLV